VLRVLQTGNLGIALPRVFKAFEILLYILNHESRLRGRSQGLLVLAQNTWPLWTSLASGEGVVTLLFPTELMVLGPIVVVGDISVVGGKQYFPAYPKTAKIIHAS